MEGRESVGDGEKAGGQPDSKQEEEECDNRHRHVHRFGDTVRYLAIKAIVCEDKIEAGVKEGQGVRSLGCGGDKRSHFG